MPLNKERKRIYDSEYRKANLRRYRIYDCWYMMIQRCYNPKDERYKDYGGRGITVCEVWKFSFDAFYYWALAHGYADNLTISRDNNNLGYSPENCSWKDWETQAHNRRKRRHSYSKYIGVTYDGRDGTRNRWTARIMKDGVRHTLGVFMTEIEAARAYDISAKMFYKKSASLNFPNP